MLSFAADLTRSKAELVAENPLLRQQLIVLHHQINKPILSQADRLWLVLLASRVKHWKRSLLILKPDTLLRWHREGFRLFWTFKSRHRGGRPTLDMEPIALIQQMAQLNRLRGAERIRGELLKLGFPVAKHAIQKYLAPIRPAKPALFDSGSGSQVWRVLHTGGCGHSPRGFEDALSRAQGQCHR